MEARIPRKKAKVKNVRYNSKAEIVAIEQSSDDQTTDEMEMESSDDESTNQASAEERAFLKAIQKEEQKATKGSDNSE